ncbi:MMPL family transporter [Actinotalea sp. K2]|uniref:MMPL family transporter n=1 Tax=Actinotalea sp. K2 TaxID=2939438 RepID=UPI002017901F|nr:MMPL family transporter [Actinotalea sp. K2]MCL3862862.1 MMPL family transporter [Actinotalea sp. K2]
MSGVFDTLGRLVARAPRRTIAVWAVFTAVCFALAFQGVGGQTLFERLSSGAPAVPGSQSATADEILTDESLAGPTLTLAVQGVAPADTEITEELGAVLAEPRTELLGIPGVAAVIDPFVLPGGPASPAATPLVAADGDGFLVVVELERDLDDAVESDALAAVEDRLDRIPAELSQVAPGVSGQVGGTTLIIQAITDQVEHDLATGEAIALPIALLVMVMVFGGFLAASMPMAGALASIAGGIGALFALSHWLDMDASVVNVVTLLGLGLSIDYGLLIVSRFREELHTLVDVDQGAAVRKRRGDGAVETALRRTMQTAGRTVAFSALIVAISVSGLIVFEPSILRAFGVAGVAVILVALATAMTLVPALLRLAGRRLIQPGLVHRIPGLRAILARTGDVVAEEGVFSRLAARVQRRPWTVLGACLLVLGVLAIPLAHIELRNSTIELLPAGSDQRDYVQTIGEQYPASESPAVIVVAEGSIEEVAEWSAGLAEVPDVLSVDQVAPVGPYVVVGVRPDTADPGGAVAREVVLAVRDVEAPFPTWVTGQAANQIDFTQALVDRAPWAIGIVVLATFVLLFLMTGSVVIPVKALLTNAISLCASLGVLVWVFQDGNLSGVLRFVSTGGIETYVVALIIAFGFGLAMDYEVFLLSRIKELHDAGYSNDDSVRLGLQRSGRIITSAALIIIVVFTGFVFGELLVIKEVGFSLAVAVLIDATLVRMLLVPATMTLLGRHNWWAPRPLRRVYRRFAITH